MSWLSWTTVVWSILVSTSLILALQHLFIWFRQPGRQWAHLSFSIFAIAVAIVTVMEFMAMHTESLEQMAALLRWAHLPILVFFAAIACFVHCFFAAGRLWLALTACGLQTLTLVLGFTTGSNQFFKEMTGLKHIAIWGGETISIPEGVLNPWYAVGPLSALALIAFVLDASISMWKRGTDTDRRRTVVFSGGILFFLLIAPGHAALVNVGFIDSPYIVGISFIPTLIATSFELSCEVLRAAQLAQRLQVSEAALRISEQRMALAASAAELGLWEWDIGNDEIWSTDNGRALFGIPKWERISFDRFLNTLYAEDREPVKRAVARALAGGDYDNYYESEYRVVLPDGQLRWFSAFGRIDFDGNSPLYMHGVAIDITRRKQAELEAQRQRSELAHLARVNMLGELSGSLAHELNQPLSAILSNAQAALRFLRQDAQNLDEVRDILKDIVDEDKRAGEVIHRLHLLLKKGEVHHQPLDVNDVVRDVLKFLRVDLLHHNIVVNVDLAPDLPAILGDRVQIQQVLINLLMNGCEAADNSDIAERLFHVRSAFSGGAVQISVVDQGQGIATADMEKIFEPFFTTKAQGMGLGLTICRNIVTAHGGRFWAENNDGRGASFHFTLPAYSGAKP